MSENPSLARAYEVHKHHRTIALIPQPKHSWTKNIIDRQHNKYFTRTPINWLALLGFYVIFMCVLAGLCAVCYVVFETTLTSDKPTRIQQQPGFSFQPCFDHKTGICLIDYREGDEENYEPYVRRVYEFLVKYTEEDTDYFGPCNWDTSYGFATSQPCIFLKVNRIIGYVADNIQVISELPVSAPDELRKYILGLPAAEKTDKLWISCQANTDTVELKFYPNRFVLNKDVIFTKKLIKRNSYHKTIYENGAQVALNADKIFYDNDDLKRIVAVQLVNIPRNYVVKVKCYLWAKNIKIEPSNNIGLISVHIKINK